MEYILFTLAGEEFGIPVDQVMEISKVPQISFLPRCPDFIEGIITVRKHSIMVMDLRKKFCICDTPNEIPSHVVIAKADGMIIGLLVDRVNDIMDISNEHMDSTAELARGFVDADATSGIAHIGDRVVIILDLASIFDPMEKKSLRKIVTKK